LPVVVVLTDYLPVVVELVVLENQVEQIQVVIQFLL
jgi:hypothetical protein|tara:strand:+ start:849 stop:956 length:108 start_codon:yes stop_codon:yes gene_type:complete